LFKDTKCNVWSQILLAVWHIYYFLNGGFYRCLRKKKAGIIMPASLIKKLLSLERTHLRD
jgi:hypothetical protein